MTSQAFDCKNYGEFLFNELKLPFSSSMNIAHHGNLQIDLAWRDKSGLIDSLSAKVILEQWIKEGPELKELVGNKQI